MIAFVAFVMIFLGSATTVCALSCVDRWQCPRSDSPVNGMTGRFVLCVTTFVAYSFHVESVSFSPVLGCSVAALGFKKHVIPAFCLAVLGNCCAKALFANMLASIGLALVGVELRERLCFATIYTPFHAFGS